MSFTIATLRNGTIQASEGPGGVNNVVVSGQIVSIAATGFAEAMTEAYAQLPVRGSTVTVAGRTLTLDNRQVTISDKGVADVTLNYIVSSRDGQVDPIEAGFRISGGLQTIRDAKDINGDAIVLTYKDEAQGGEIDFQLPQTTISFTFREQSANPYAVPREWTGKLNQGTWAGSPEGRWMCTGVDVTLTDLVTTPNPTYEFVYSFTEDPDGWQPQVVFIDPETNKPPADWADNPGASVTVEKYELKNFGAKFPI